MDLTHLKEAAAVIGQRTDSAWQYIYQNSRDCCDPLKSWADD
jgi:hypothetical protein